MQTLRPILLLIFSLCACNSKPVDRTPPPGALAHSFGESSGLALTLYEDTIEFRKDGQVEASYDLVDFEGSNLTPGGAVLFFGGGVKRLVVFKDYGGKAAKEITERVMNGEVEDSESSFSS